MAPNITIPQIVIRQKILKRDAIELTNMFIIRDDVSCLVRPPVTLTALVSELNFVADAAHCFLGVDASTVASF
jgi:hypothetical protein